MAKVLRVQWKPEFKLTQQDTAPGNKHQLTEGVVYINEPVDVTALPTAVLVQVRNAFNADKDIKKFETREIGLKAVTNLLVRNGILPAGTQPAADVASAPGTSAGATTKESTDTEDPTMAVKTKKAKTPKTPRAAKAPKEAAIPRLERPFSLKPKAKTKIIAVRAGTKRARLITLLNRENGATLTQISEALSETGKKVTPAYAKAWVSYSLNNQVGYGAESDGKRVWLTLPEGMKEPLDHIKPGNGKKNGKGKE